MHDTTLRTLILAAGKGTRMKSRKAKVLHQAGGLALIQHVVAAARAISPDVWIVVGHQAETVRELIPDANYVEQTEQLGTGHAVKMAAEAFRGYTGEVLVLSGDAPLITVDTLQRLLDFHRSEGCAASVLTADAPDPAGYGRIIRKGDCGIEAIVEHKDATPEVRLIPEINSGIYVFKSPALFESLAKIRNANSQKEFYLTDVIAILASEGQKVGAFKTQRFEEILGINTRMELGEMDRRMRQQKCQQLMADGVTIIDPDTTFIDACVEIGTDTVIYPSVQIYGHSVIGDDVTIHSFSRISNAKVGHRVSVLEGCVVVDSELGDDVSVGPYAHLRMHTTLDSGAKIGNFVELKNSKVGAGTKAMHLSYLGDATIGQKVNIGAGTITCNYDGVNKHPTIIEDGVFIGSDSQLVAPVTIGKNAYVGAGSSITEDVPADSLAIARGRQIVKEGWVRSRRKK